MSSKPSKTIERPTDRQEVEFDGRLPKHFDFISSGRIEFTNEDVGKAFHHGEIDDITRDFLWNVLTEASVDEVTKMNVIRDSRLYMARLLGGMKPGQDLFIRMQELGMKHHVGSIRDGEPVDLDISQYTVPEVQLDGGIIAGNFIMFQTTVVNDVNMRKAKIGGDVYQEKAKIGGNVFQEGAKIGGNVNQIGAKIEGAVYQERAEIGGGVDQQQAKIGRTVDQSYAKIGGSVNQDLAKICGDVDQSYAEIGGGVDQASAEIGGNVYQQQAKIVGEVSLGTIRGNPSDTIDDKNTLMTIKSLAY